MISKFYAPLIAKRDELQKNDKGFTLIELLVVVLIIGILAAIAIPIFLGQQDQAKASAAKADLSTAKTAYVSYLVENPSGTTTSATDATLVKNGFPSTVTITTGGSNFCLTFASPAHHIAYNDNSPQAGATC